jgi:hypothetical protein
MDQSIEFSAHASLVALGVRFQQLGLWSMVQAHVTIKQKVRQHAPLDKLLDGFINILAGGRGVVEINTRVRPDRALQQAFGRSACAEQSTISDTLDACTPANVEQMRAALTAIARQHGQAYRHDYQQAWQLLEVAMTGRPAVKARGSPKAISPNSPIGAGGSWAGCWRPAMTKSWSTGCTTASASCIAA